MQSQLIQVHLHLQYMQRRQNPFFTAAPFAPAAAAVAAGHGCGSCRCSTTHDHPVTESRGEATTAAAEESGSPLIIGLGVGTLDRESLSGLKHPSTAAPAWSLAPPLLTIPVDLNRDGPGAEQIMEPPPPPPPPPTVAPVPPPTILIPACNG